MINQLRFNIYKHPIFAILITYIWIEITNPILPHILQIIPRVSNSHIFILFAWILLPKHLKEISLPFKKLLYILPFLIIITIKVPFVTGRFENTVIAVISEWIFYLLYFPIFIKILTSKSGRENFFICVTISTLIGCGLYIMSLNGINFTDDVVISSNSLSSLTVFGLPVALRGVYFKSSFIRNFYFFSLIVLLFTFIISGSRSSLIIAIIQIFSFSFYFLSPRKLIISGLGIFVAVFLISSLISVDQKQLDYRDKKFDRIMNWKEDGSIFLRIALYSKARDIFINNIFFGVGWGAKTISGVEGADVEFSSFDRDEAFKTGKKGVHSTLLRIISGTGLLGIIAFLFFVIKNIKYFARINFSVIKKIPEFFVLLAISIGLILDSLQNTTSASTFLFISSFIISTHLYLKQVHSLYIMQFKN